LEEGIKPNTGLAQDRNQDIAQVKENILAVDFGQFKSQVVSYLEPELQPQYDTEETWDVMRWRIIEALGEGSS
jgi:hypothetical protein